MVVLFPTHLFEGRDMLSLLFTHLSKLLDGVVGPAQLIPKHIYIALHILCDSSLAIHFDVEGAQMV